MEEGRTMIEKYHFWMLAHYFIREENYRILHFSKEKNELWLEHPDEKQAPIIRLLNCVLDWSSWLERDIQLTGLNGERIRKQKFKKNLHILNIYISPYPPVDDYEDKIKRLSSFDQTRIQSIIMTRDSVSDLTQQIQSLFHNKITIPLPESFTLTDEIIEEIQKSILQINAKRVQAERNIFSYGKPFVTYVFIAIQMVVFLLLELNGGSENSSTLVEFGAKFNPLILEGEWWRFFTPIFIHIGILHLIMNSVGLYFLGSAVERIYGSSRFLGIYLFAGMIGSIASFSFSPNISAGASGAIYGCFGALLYIWLVYPKLFFRTVGTNVISILILNIVMSFTVPSIDIFGHLGGLLGGFLATGIVHFPQKRKYGSQLIFLLLAIFITSFLLFYGYNRPVQFESEATVLQLAQDYVKDEEYQKSYNLLTNYLNHSNNMSDYYYFQLSYVEYQLKMYDKAEDHLNKAIEINPKYHEAHFNLALILLQKQEYEKAKQQAEKAVELAPSNQKYKDLFNSIK